MIDAEQWSGYHGETEATVDELAHYAARYCPFRVFFMGADAAKHTHEPIQNQKYRACAICGAEQFH
jgi:hypothetical protein